MNQPNKYISSPSAEEMSLEVKERVESKRIQFLSATDIKLSRVKSLSFLCEYVCEAVEEFQY